MSSVLPLLNEYIEALPDAVDRDRMKSLLSSSAHVRDLLTALFYTQTPFTSIVDASRHTTPRMNPVESATALLSHLLNVCTAHDDEETLGGAVYKVQEVQAAFVKDVLNKLPPDHRRILRFYVR